MCVDLLQASMYRYSDTQHVIAIFGSDWFILVRERTITHDNEIANGHRYPLRFQHTFDYNLTTMAGQQHPLEMIYRSSNRKDCQEHTLVLKAAGIRHRMEERGTEFTIFVASQDATRSLSQFAAYARENHDFKARPIIYKQHSDSWYGVYCYVAVMLIVAICARDDLFHFDWFEAGKTHANQIQTGQWWRTITALTLHSDLSHMLANLVIGSLFGYFAGQMLGVGLAWLSILLAGAAGNLMNAWIRHATHTSIGASTAVFATLGIVAAYAWSQRKQVHISKLNRWTPLVGGALLLSFLGTGGGNTDVMAHVTGFISGVTLGIIYAKLGDRVIFQPKAQLLLGMAALTILGIAWTLAGTHYVRYDH